ncbi:hypothetical protein WJX73_007369 [Symbiochloris irregularis]|uniref:AAA+ ATPase domain-containing protein n=1 Tax=Symbiochloris irregularis TaxID=706552 RepID=A0AAW1NR90_9CHLO
MVTTPSHALAAPQCRPLHGRICRRAALDRPRSLYARHLHFCARAAASSESASDQIAASSSGRTDEAITVTPLQSAGPNTGPGDQQSPSEGNSNRQRGFINAFAHAIALRVHRAYLLVSIWALKRTSKDSRKRFLQRFRRGIVLGTAAFVGVGVLLSLLDPLRRPPHEVMYSDFLAAVNTGKVQTARIDDSTSHVYFRTQAAGQEAASTSSASDSNEKVSPTSQRASAQQVYFTKRVNDPNLVPMLLAHGVRFGAVKATITGALGRMLGTVFALWLPLVPLFLVMRHALGGRSSMSKKRAGNEKYLQSGVTFSDVAGVEAACQELMEVVACLRDAAQYTALNAKTPSGVLLCGPPGTGKTLLARAVAGEANVPFFAAAASEFVELFVGRGAARIRDLFAEARKRAPAVVFIDELDAIGGRRGLGMNEERDQTLNQLLTELDGFEGRQGVLLLAATNRPEVLDAALTRPGRLSRRVVVPLPDEKGRSDILAVHLRNTPMATPADKEQACTLIAKHTRGFSGAQLANVVNEGALLAGRKGAKVVEIRELLEAIDRTRNGIDGGAGTMNLIGGWRTRIREMLIESLSDTKSMQRAIPLSGG